MNEAQPKVGVLMGSASDWPVLQHAAAILAEFGVPHECKVVSAHRMPDEMFAYATSARERGLVAIIALLVGLVVTALSVARERELGTFDQLMVSPLSAPEILIGKTVPPLIIGHAHATLYVLVAVFLFGVPFRERGAAVIEARGLSSAASAARNWAIPR